MVIAMKDVRNNYKYSHAYPVVECFNGKASHKCVLNMFTYIYA